METRYSKDALIDFLDKAIESGEINQSTGQAKKKRGISRIRAFRRHTIRQNERE